VLRPVFEASGGADDFVSIDSPQVSQDIQRRFRKHYCWLEGAWKWQTVNGIIPYAVVSPWQNVVRCRAQSKTRCARSIRQPFRNCVRPSATSLYLLTFQA
jgi:hypothetical protein